MQKAPKLHFEKVLHDHILQAVNPRHTLHAPQTTASYFSDTAILHIRMLNACGRTERRYAHKGI